MVKRLGPAALACGWAVVMGCASSEAPTLAAGGASVGGSSTVGGHGGEVAIGGDPSSGGTTSNGGAGAGGGTAPAELFDPLTDAALTPGEAEKQVHGGTFVSDGWQATDATSQIVIRLADPLTNPGRLEIDVTNFDPKAQSTGAKHEIVSLYTQANGSKAIFETLGSWWNLRTGTNYLADPMGIKFLSAVQGVSSREETRLPTPVSWDVSQTYRFSINWDEIEISISLDDEWVWTHSWGSMAEAFEYVFIGTNNVYDAQVGPVYSNLRITQ